MPIQAKDTQTILREYRALVAKRIMLTLDIAHLGSHWNPDAVALTDEEDAWLRSALASHLLWAAYEIDNKCGDCNGHSEDVDQLVALAQKIVE